MAKFVGIMASSQCFEILDNLYVWDQFEKHFYSNYFKTELTRHFVEMSKYVSTSNLKNKQKLFWK